MMSVKVEKLEGKVKLEFTIEKEAFVKAIDEVYKENIKHFAIPGFRKGKVPKAMVEKYYGETIFFQDAFDKVANEEYVKALQENNIKAIATPEVDVQEMSKENGVKFTAIVEVEPEITLGKYKGIELKKVEYNVTDEDVENRIKEVAAENARIITIEDNETELKQGDISTIDFEGFVDDVAFEGGKGENYDLEIGSGSFIPGFEDQLVGMKIGEEREINVTFPEQYHADELKGKPAVFKVKLNGIKVKELPTIDDEFVKDVSEFDTLEEYKKDIKAKLEHENKHREEHEMEHQVIEKLLEETKFDVPQAMIDNEVNAKIEEIKHNMQHQGIDFDMYLQMVGQKIDDVKVSLEEQAKKDVQTRLIIDAIIATEKIEVTDEDIEEKMKEMAYHRNVDVEEIRKTFNENVINYYKANMVYEKAIKFVIENAKIK
ncbi:MAG: trigger factor [Clostridiales bacterium]|nr:trigger factor [Clostridiales bacterium]